MQKLHALAVTARVVVLAFALLAGIRSTTSAAKSPKPITITLNNGIEMPMFAVGMGTAGGRVAEVIEVNVANGVRHIDTAQAYGSDELVGNVIAQLPVPRSELFITSKVNGCDASDEPAECTAKTKDQISTNVANLGVAYVDLLLIHWPPMPSACATPAGCAVYRAQWRSLEEAHEAGLARAIGISNACTMCYDCLLATAKVLPQVNQLNFQAGEIRVPPTSSAITTSSISSISTSELQTPRTPAHARTRSHACILLAHTWIAS